jgi:hypothetical protein
MPIYDRVYKGTEMRLDLELMKRRLRISQGQTRKVSLMQERMQLVEDRITKKHETV